MVDHAIFVKIDKGKCFLFPHHPNERGKSTRTRIQVISCVSGQLCFSRWDLELLRMVGSKFMAGLIAAPFSFKRVLLIARNSLRRGKNCFRAALDIPLKMPAESALEKIILSILRIPRSKYLEAFDDDRWGLQQKKTGSVLKTTGSGFETTETKQTRMKRPVSKKPDTQVKLTRNSSI